MTDSMSSIYDEEQVVDHIEDDYIRLPDYPKYKVMRVTQVFLIICFISGLIASKEYSSKCIGLFAIIPFFIAAILGCCWEGGKRRCPRCGEDMQYFKPDEYDEITTHKHICHQCKVYIDTKQANIRSVD